MGRQRAVLRRYFPEEVGMSSSSGRTDGPEASSALRGMVQPGIAAQGLSGLRHGEAGMAKP